MPHRQNTLKSIPLGALLLAAALIAHPAWAGLGDPETAVSADAVQLQGSLKATQRLNYNVHEMLLPSGTVVREYAAAGIVFAVAWSGPSIPDLKQTLGRYFDVFVAGAKAQPGNRHHLQVEQNEFVMQSSGHMRSFSGRAYLTTGMPAGVSTDELR